MPIMLNTVLREADYDPAEVRLLRHKDHRSSKGRTPFELWRDAPAQFQAYQATQSIENRPKLGSPYWMSFVGTPRGETLFVGLYAVKYLGLLREDRPMPHTEGIDKAGSCDEYALDEQERLGDFKGKLIIDWGAGARAWVQYADRNDKPITELRRVFEEPPFPGFMQFAEPLSRIEALPRGWIDVLRSSRGVYLLTCPRTREQYVGSATGEECFWQRWAHYARTTHGGNVGLKSRDPSDYQVSILEVAGSAATTDDVKRMEGRWQKKLQSREMGLNRNSAGGLAGSDQRPRLLHSS